MARGAEKRAGAGTPPREADARQEDEAPDSRLLRIVNRKGLHARASARFVATVSAFDAAVVVEKDGEEVSGDDLLGLLMLAGSCGSTIEVSAAGPDAVAALDAIEALVADGFGEDDRAP